MQCGVSEPLPSNLLRSADLWRCHYCRPPCNYGVFQGAGPTPTGKSTNEILHFNETCVRQFFCQLLYGRSFWPLVWKETAATLTGGPRWRFTPVARSVLPAWFWFWSGQKKEMCQWQMNKRSQLVRSRGQLQPNEDGMRAEQRSDLDHVVMLILKSKHCV